MASKKKVATSVAAVATAAALLLGGTFAWQSISQTALNEASDVVNPGGRLHDDFDGTDKNVYVENFAEDEIFARVRFDEYFEIIMNYGSGAAEKTEHVVGETRDDPTTYVTHLFDEDADNATDDYWDWTMGSADSEAAYYMPTFNLNKDSLAADVNGVFNGANFTITDKDDGDQYEESYVDYSEVTEKTGYEIYDGDSNSVDELSQQADTIKAVNEIVNSIIDDGDGSQYYANAADSLMLSEQVTHYATQVNSETGFMSMAEWIDAGSQPGPYWVYDTDGWCYWAQPIAAGDTTGLLLDGIALDGVMDDTWYYAINVIGQFITADDIGDGTEENPGFMMDGMTDSAKTLLGAIGVDVNGVDGGEEETIPDGISLANMTMPDGAVYLADYDTYYLSSNASAGDTGGLSEVWAFNPVLYADGEEVENVTWAYEVTGTATSDTIRMGEPADENGVVNLGGATWDTQNGIFTGAYDYYQVDVAITATYPDPADAENSITVTDTVSIGRFVDIYLVYMPDMDDSSTYTDTVTLGIGEEGKIEFQTDSNTGMFGRMGSSYFAWTDNATNNCFSGNGSEGIYTITHTGSDSCVAGEKCGDVTLSFVSMPYVAASIDVYCGSAGSESDIPEYTEDNDNISITFANMDTVDNKAYEEDWDGYLYFVGSTTAEFESVSYVICDAEGKKLDSGLIDQEEIKDGMIAVLTDVPEDTQKGDEFTAVFLYTAAGGETYGKSATVEWNGITIELRLRYKSVNGEVSTFEIFSEEEEGVVAETVADVSRTEDTEIAIDCEDGVASWSVENAGGVVSVEGTTLTIASGDTSSVFYLVGSDADGTEQCRFEITIERASE